MTKHYEIVQKGCSLFDTVIILYTD